MSEFWKRTLFGALYVAAVVGSILWNAWAFAFLFGVIALWAVREFHVLMGSSHGMRGGAQVATLILWCAVQCPLLASDGLATSWGVYVLLGVAYLLVVFALLIDELWSRAANPVANWGNLFISQTMIALPFCAMTALYALDKWLLLALFVLIWVNDTGAFLVGIMLGKHRLFERISPKKSWEGFIGGVAVTVAVAFALDRWCNDFFQVPDLPLWVGLSVVVAIASTLGDLVESLLKRTVGVKDSGKLMPGHGGILDRIDSLLMVSPAVLAYLILMAYLRPM